MVNDTLDILDAKVVNIGIEFEVVSEGENKFDVLEEATRTLRTELVRHYFIGERFKITDVYSILNSVRGVADTSNVKIKVKKGGRYSQTGFTIENQMSADGRYIAVPDNVALEIKFPKSDIKGSIR